MKYSLNKIDSPAHVRRLFGLCWLVYCVSYVGRLNYSAAMTGMLQEGLLDPGQAGFISMLYFFSYGIGQLVNGFLGDRLNPRKMIFAGLCVSAAANAGMGIAGSFAVMAFCWGVNGYFQAMLWSPIIRIFAEMMHKKDKMRCSVNITSSGIVGTLFSYLLSAVLMAWLHWKFVFLIAAVLLIGAAFIFDAGFRSILSYSRRNLSEAGDGRPFGTTTAPNSISVQHRRQGRDMAGHQCGTNFKTLLCCSEILLLLLPVMIHGVLKDGVTAWVPSYISGNFGLAPSFSILLTAVLPVINLTGAYAGWAVYRRLHENIARSSAIFFTVSAAALLLLLTLGKVSVVLTVLLLAVITSSMLAVNTLTISIYPLKFEREGRVSSVSGFLNAMAYLGTAVSTFAVGVLVEHGGWHITILVWLLLTVLAGAICVIIKKDKK